MPRLIDLSRPIVHRGPSTRSQPVPAVWTNTSHDDSREALKGRWSFSSKGLILSDHSGTHADAFSHLDPSPDALAIDQMDVNLFYRQALCVDFSAFGPGEFIQETHVEHGVRAAGGLGGADALLYRTGHYPGPPADPDLYLRGFPGLSEAAMEWLADQGIALIGTEARSIDCAASELPDAPDLFPAHRVCQKRKVLIVENLLIPPELAGQRFSFLFLPLKIRGGTGGPGRAVAILPD